MERKHREQSLRNSCIQKIRQINDEYESREGRRRTYFVLTFGCQMNVHDSEKIEGMLIELGYAKANDWREADFVLHNTCCIRENAENKVYGSLGYFKRMKQTRPDVKVGLCGCMMQQDGVIEKIKKTYDCVDIIFGTFNLHRFPELLLANLETGSMIVDIWKEHAEADEDLPTLREYQHKAAINIMYGCDNFCSYCIVPYVRGRERSREPVEILREAAALVADGAKEILFLGQNVNSYAYGFAELLREADKIPGLERIRFMTSHPKDLSSELIDAIRDCKTVCRHIHLPIQSGSTSILNAMNRGYSKESYLTLIEKIRREIPDVSITTDIIVGFPGETEEDFEETLDAVRKADFSSAFTFIYSKREGTPAAQLPEVDAEAVKDRFARLMDMLKPRMYEINRSYIGKRLRVLADEVSKNNEELLTGRADGSMPVHFKADKSLIGEMLEIEILDCKTFYLIGRVC